MRSLSIGATGMLAQQMNVEVISNNIANMNTTGFKRQRAEFQDLLYQSHRRVGSASTDAGTVVPAGVQVGAGVQAAAVYRIHEQGNLEVTENPLDLAINGNGFFQVELPGGETAYTRAGTFQLSPDGQLITPDGHAVLGPGAIPPEAQQIAINTNGEVMVALRDQVDVITVGQLQLATFPNTAGLEAIGDNLLLETPASGQPVAGPPGANGLGVIEQGMVETANVNIVSEITKLIAAQRAYEMNSRTITTTDEMMRSVTQMR